MIIKDKNELSKPCEEIKDYEEAEKIASELLKTLASSKKGIGLAANQIGINKRVCVINVKEPVVLINPKIIERSKETFVFPEGCLSFPKDKIRTTRHVSIKVEADNYDGELLFNADSKNIDDAFECACVQHEIDHLDGITMFDREIKKLKPFKREGKKIGRNEKVLIKKGSETKTIKYKKFNKMSEDGWTLAEV